MSGEDNRLSYWYSLVENAHLFTELRAYIRVCQISRWLFSGMRKIITDCSKSSSMSAFADDAVMHYIKSVCEFCVYKLIDLHFITINWFWLASTYKKNNGNILQLKVCLIIGFGTQLQWNNQRRTSEMICFVIISYTPLRWTFNARAL